MIRRLALVVLLALPCAWVPTAPASAASSADDNAAVAVNTHDGSSVFRFAFRIVQVSGEVVDASNAAVAYASCNECSTVAIAIQIVLVDGSPDTFAPQNVAVALNEGCSSCQTLASAYQIVIQGGGRARLSPEGERELRAVLHRIRALRRSGLDAAAMQAAVDEQVGLVQQIFATQLVYGPEPAGSSTSSTTSSSSTTQATGTTTTVAPSTTVRSSTSTTGGSTTTSAVTTSTTTAVP